MAPVDIGISGCPFVPIADVESMFPGGEVLVGGTPWQEGTPTDAAAQVWSLTQLDSVDFSQSRIGEKVRFQ